jgi:hypothetical protein
MHRLGHLITVACVGVSLIAGCGVEQPPPKQAAPPTRQASPPTLSPEAARRALLDLVEHSQRDDLARTLPDLEQAAPRDLGNGQLAIGDWTCDLINRRFVLTISAEPPAKEYSGAFKLRADEWTAVAELQVHRE